MEALNAARERGAKMERRDGHWDAVDEASRALVEAIAVDLCEWRTGTPAERKAAWQRMRARG